MVLSPTSYNQGYNFPWEILLKIWISSYEITYYRTNKVSLCSVQPMNPSWGTLEKCHLLSTLDPPFL